MPSPPTIAAASWSVRYHPSDRSRQLQDGRRPTEANGLHHCSEVMVEKLAGVARERLNEVVGQLDRATMTAVERALLLVLYFA